MKIAFFDTRPYDQAAFEKMNQNGEFEIKFFDGRLTVDTAELAKDADAVCVFVNDTVDAAVIDRLYALGVRMIALRCAGFNNVDVQHCFGKIHVFHVPAYSPNAVAEHAMAMLLTSIRRIHKAYIRTRDFNFSLSGLTGFELHGKTVGVVGTGKIGRTFIDICRGFGMRVLAYDMYPNPALGDVYVPLDTLFAESDIISLHCPLTEQTHHLVNAQTIAQMKKGVMIVNTSRGALIVSLPNVIVTSHQAFLTEEALGSIAETTFNNLREFSATGMCANELCYRCGKIEQCMKNKNKKCF